MKFKVGDRVIIKPGINTPAGGWGGMQHHKEEVGTITGVNPGNMNPIVINFPHHSSFSTNENSIIMVHKHNKNKEITSCDYAFKCNVSAIDEDELLESTSRKYPIATVITNDPNVSYIAIHRSIIKKSIICDIKFFTKFGKINSNSGCVFYVENRKYFGDIISWAKRVKNAKWPKRIELTHVVNLIDI